MLWRCLSDTLRCKLIRGELSAARCRSSWAFTLVVCICALGASRASAEPCGAAAIEPTQVEPAAVFAEARAYASDNEYAKARAIYLWLLERDAKDREARLALSRLDAWEHCYNRAEQRYHTLLREKPADIEARAGLIDILMWSERWPEARTQIDLGLALTPNAPELWQRLARWLRWSGDRAAAMRAAERAEALAPDDLDTRLLRDRLFIGQLRAGLRIDVFPHVYPDLYTATIGGLQYWKRLELGVDAQVITRTGSVDRQAIVDGLYTATGIYHANGGSSVGVSLGFGAPARAIPAFTAKGWFLLQIASRWSGFFAYSFWQYHNDKTAHIFAPAVGYALTDDIQLELRWWTSFLVLQRPMASAATAVVNAVSGRVTWRVLTPWFLGMSYTYGPQLDQAPTQYTFLHIQSHVFNVYADWLVSRRWGVSPLLGFEWRRAQGGAPVALIYSGEVASYVRW
jgi:tetratricopeptide (TPR) repeat protein